MKTLPALIAALSLFAFAAAAFAGNTHMGNSHMGNTHGTYVNENCVTTSDHNASGLSMGEMLP